MTSILAFSYNSQSNRLAENISPDVVENNRDVSYISMMSPKTWRYQGDVPDFWTPFEEKIKQEQPKIVTVGFQEDVRPGSYFHSHFLPDRMKGLNYSLHGRTTLMGIGQTTATGLSQADPFVRGLRLSVYVHSDFRYPRSTNCKDRFYSSSFFRNKGAVAIYITLPDNEVLAIINTHFPFDATSLNKTVLKRDLMIRHNSIMLQDQFFNEAYRYLVLEAPVRPKYVLLMGDLNYRIDPFVNWSAYETGKILLETLQSSPEEYQKMVDQHDELRKQFRKGNLYPFLEGIDDRGPIFAPTCKMEKDRPAGSCRLEDYSLGKLDQRVPSHCDRILHQKMICLKYDRFDHGVMVKSDHAGVVGLYQV